VLDAIERFAQRRERCLDGLLTMSQVAVGDRLGGGEPGFGQRDEKPRFAAERIAGQRVEGLTQPLVRAGLHLVTGTGEERSASSAACSRAASAPLGRLGAGPLPSEQPADREAHRAGPPGKQTSISRC